MLGKSCGNAGLGRYDEANAGVAKLVDAQDLKSYLPFLQNPAISRNKPKQSTFRCVSGFGLGAKNGLFWSVCQTSVRQNLGGAA